MIWKDKPVASKAPGSCSIYWVFRSMYKWLCLPHHVGEHPPAGCLRHPYWRDSYAQPQPLQLSSLMPSLFCLLQSGRAVLLPTYEVEGSPAHQLTHMGKLALFLVSSVPLVCDSPSAALPALWGQPLLWAQKSPAFRSAKGEAVPAERLLPSRPAQGLPLVHAFASVRLPPLLDEWLCCPTVLSCVCPPPQRCEQYFLSHLSS